MSAEAHDSSLTQAARPALTLGTAIGALGVVFGDIGTSPLYAFKESVSPGHGAGPAPDVVLGVLSMIFWAVLLVVSLKYVVIVMRADNQGEGGILALLSLVLGRLPVAHRLRVPAVLLGLLGAAMFYGDSAITPAISVLSAMEGLEVVSPALKHWVLPLTLGVLLLLFACQRHGTARVGVVFGPIMLLWFVTIAVLGVVQIAQRPEVLHAIEPLHALRLVTERPGLALVLLGAVFLSVTGGEALYADMGHFGRAPIRAAWYGLVMPALLLNYFGQGALVLGNPEAARNPFFLMAPSWLVLPLVLLAASATVIASQAVISGAFSMTAQAVKLGYLPRTEIEYTSETHAGQIYVPMVNWLLLVLVVALVLGFGSSDRLASAYGIAVSSTMVVTALGALFIARTRWDWPLWRVALVFLPLLALDLMFVSANATKIDDGGWVPLLFAVLLMAVFTTWKRGRQLMQQALTQHGLALLPFLRSLDTHPPTRIEGTAVFLTSEPDSVPHALLHNLKHNQVMHERVIFLTIVTESQPHVEPQVMTLLTDLGDGCYSVTVKLGFQDEADIEVVARNLARYHDYELSPAQSSFFLSRQSISALDGKGMALWRKRLFSWLMRSAQPVSDYLHIPPNRVLEIGTQLNI